MTWACSQQNEGIFWLTDQAIRDAGMNRSHVDKMVDELIGEAVLSLLKENGPINTHALVQRLRSMRIHEKDPERQEAISAVIAEISDSTDGAFKHYKAVQHSVPREGARTMNNDNVVPLFGNGKPADPKKIH